MLIWLYLGGKKAIKGLNVLVFPPLIVWFIVWFKRGLVHLVKASVILSHLISQKAQIWETERGGEGMRKVRKKWRIEWENLWWDLVRGNGDGELDGLVFQNPQSAVKQIETPPPLTSSSPPYTLTPSHTWALTCMQMDRLSLKELPKGPGVGNYQACLPC